MASTRLIGIDCAAQDKNVGLAMGRIANGSVELEMLAVGKERTVVQAVAAEVAGAGPCLLALDAPLGWPVAMGRALAEHQAGQGIAVDKDRMFRRRTDDFIYDTLQKRPLDIGADRIARTALKALQQLGEVRELTGMPIPLAWQPGEVDAAHAIEVYPAGTLASRQLPSSGYKGKDGVGARATIVEDLEASGTICCSAAMRQELLASDHVLDAALCVLAAADFVRKDVLAPPEITAQVRSEGWIWVKRSGE